MSRGAKWVIGVAILVAVGIGGVAVAARGDEATEVRTEVVTRRDLVSMVTASGRIDPKRKVDVSADIAGRVTQLAVEEGQMVRKGDLLLRIDPARYEAAVRRAEAAVAQAQAQASQARASLLQARSAAQRAEQLSRGEGLVSNADVEQARTQASVAEAQFEAAQFGVAQARAALVEARDQLAKTTITAPMGGRVTRLNIEEGETAVVGTMNNPGSLLLTIADLSVMEAVVKVDETDVPLLSFGDSAIVRIDAFPNQVFGGRVTRISNSALQPASGLPGGSSASSQQSVDFEVVITLSNPPEALRPDLSATADIITDTRHRVLAVPIISLTVRDQDGKKLGAENDQEANATPQPEQRVSADQGVEGVFVMRDGKAQFVPVQVGIAGDRYFEVKQGLQGSEVVVSGTYQAIRDLEHGAAIKQQLDGADKKRQRK